MELELLAIAQVNRPGAHGGKVKTAIRIDDRDLPRVALQVFQMPCDLGLGQLSVRPDVIAQVDQDGVQVGEHRSNVGGKDGGPPFHACISRL